MDVSMRADLEKGGRMAWGHGTHGWIARPEEVVDVLAHHGYHEYKREVTRKHRTRRPGGGIWEGLNTDTESVASVIWVTRVTAEEAIVFIDIDGEVVTGE